MLTLHRVKCVVVGDAAVGKTAITQTLITEGNKFPKSYNLTFGVELSSKILNLDETEQIFEFIIYDSSGHDIYTNMLLKCWDGLDLVLAVYDVTSEQSLKNVSIWVERVKQVAPNIPTIIFGNKTDLTARRIVTTLQGEELAKQLGMVAHTEGSAKDYKGIKEAFSTLAQQLTS